MAFQVLLAANFIPIPTFHLSQEKLLAYKARDSGLCIDNTESPTCCQVIKGKDHYPDRSYNYT